MKRLSHKTWFRLAAVCFAALFIFAALFAGMSSTAQRAKSVGTQPAPTAAAVTQAPARKSLDEAALRYQAEPTDANGRKFNEALAAYQKAVAADPSIASTKNPKMAPSAMVEMQALRSLKKSLSKTQKKIGSRLMMVARRQQGKLPLVLNSLRTKVETSKTGNAVVDIIVTNRSAGLKALDRYNFNITSAIGSTIRAEVPFDQLEEIAALPQVIAIREPSRAYTHEVPRAPLAMAPLTSLERRRARLGNRLGGQLQSAISKVATQPKAGNQRFLSSRSPYAFPILNSSEGDKTHKADLARTTFGYNGTGVKIGVLSDGVDSLAAVQASGDLGPVTVLGGQAGSGDEGTAMLEIVHDLAPGAQLFFATADPTQAQFAQNILDLRTAGCDIIVDDVIYLDESPFEDSAVAQAVNTVTAGGALYFSSAGNEGNTDDSTSGTWEGDFLASAAADPGPLAGANLHNFGDGGNSILVEFGGGNPPLLIWAEHYTLATGDASTDFDLYDMDGALTTIFDASTDVQDGVGGDDFPIEFIGGGTFGGERLLIDKFAAGSTSSVPMMNLIVFRGELDDMLVTPGATRGHSAAVNAFSVAATPAAASFDGISPDGPYPGPFTAANASEDFTSDGPRRIILSPTGVELTPGNRTSTGGVVRQKPDITAADGVSCAAPGFSTFYGTSAAAPHAAAIAGLLKSSNMALTPAQIRTYLITTAIDIEAAGVDRDTGAGIVMAYEALQASGAVPVANLALGTPSFTETGGDGDGYAEPCERLSFTIPLNNIGAVTATAVSGTLTSTTPGVVITPVSSAYPDIPAAGTSNNTTQFVVTLPCGLACGSKLDLTLTATYTGGASPQSFNFSYTLGGPGAPITISYVGPPVPIGDSPGANVPGPTAMAPLVVAGVGNIFDLDFRIDGTSCNTTAGSPTVGIDHTFANDLQIQLISPSPGPTNQVIINRIDGGGNNFCQTVLDDETANPSIQSAATAPFTGTFKPANLLSVFDGLNANGTWNLAVTDYFTGDTGNIRAYSLIITPAVCTTTPCGLTCPANIVVPATGPGGAVVNYPGATVTGGCGVLNYSTPSGATFPVGTTNVTVTGAGGANCAFSVTVTPPCPPPTITCPGSISKFTDSGQAGATINPGVPAVNSACPVAITGVRSDGKPLNAQYPVGVTLISWTAKDAFNQTATCGQSIAVLVPSSPTRHPGGEEEALLAGVDLLLNCLAALW